MWRRWIIALFAVAALAGAGLAGWRHLFAERVLRVAIDAENGTDAALLTAISDWMQSSGKRYRFRFVVTGSAAESQRLLRARQVDLASIRADAIASGAGIASQLVLYNEAAVLIAAEGGGIAGWNSLNRRTLALAGDTTAKDPLLESLLRLAGVDEALLKPLPPDQALPALQRREAQGVAFVGPVPGPALAGLRRAGALRDSKLNLSAIELADAEELAKRDRRYAEVTIPAGSLRLNPPLPAEAISTLGVARHLMVREALPGLMINRLTHAMLDAKRALLAEHPLLAQMGAPDLEADAHVRVHKGSRVLFQGEERPIGELIMEWIYAVPLLIGLVGTGVMGVIRWLRPPKRPAGAGLVGELLALRREASKAASLAEIAGIRQKLDRLSERAEPALAAGDEAARTLLVALDLADRQVLSRRLELDRVAEITGRPA
jgi:TRAP-type uncharacterized transport system substrate-binding protein